MFPCKRKKKIVCAYNTHNSAATSEEEKKQSCKSKCLSKQKDSVHPMDRKQEEKCDLRIK